MNPLLLIARKTSLSSKKSGVSFSGLVSRIAVISIAISLALIIVAFGVLLGFKNTIKDKVFSFSGHMRITKTSNNESFEEPPLSVNTKLFSNKEKIGFIDHFQVYAQKAGIIKTKENVQGILLKGIDASFKSQTFKNNLLEGRLINTTGKSEYSKEIVISKNISNRLSLQLKDSILVIFIQDSSRELPRIRKLAVVGIYETGMEIFDEKMVLVDLRLIQKLNKWGDTLVSGYEIFVKDFDELVPNAQFMLDTWMGYDMDLQLITQRHFDIFEWLILLDNNVLVFLTMILFVSGINLMAILLIMMMERIQMIGLLKALGATNRQIRQIFLLKGLSLVLKGFLLGNFLGVGICAAQYYWKIVPLDAQNYYMNTIPVFLDASTLLFINAGSLLLVTLVLLLPTLIISAIRPIKSIRFS